MGYSYFGEELDEIMNLDSLFPGLAPQTPLESDSDDFGPIVATETDKHQQEPSASAGETVHRWTRQPLRQPAAPSQQSGGVYDGVEQASHFGDSARAPDFTSTPTLTGRTGSVETWPEPQSTPAAASPVGGFADIRQQPTTLPAQMFRPTGDAGLATPGRFQEPVPAPFAPRSPYAAPTPASDGLDELDGPQTPPAVAAPAVNFTNVYQQPLPAANLDGLDGLDDPAPTSQAQASQQGFGAVHDHMEIVREAWRRDPYVSRQRRPLGRRNAPPTATAPAPEPRENRPGNRKGAEPAWPQAFKLHKRFCHSTTGCVHDCPVKNDYPERHAEYLGTLKSVKHSGTGERVRVPRLWAHEHEERQVRRGQR